MFFFLFLCIAFFCHGIGGPGSLHCPCVQRVCMDAVPFIGVCVCVCMLVCWSAAFGISIWLMLTCRPLSTEKNPLIHPYPFLVRLATESMLARSLALSRSISCWPYTAISLWPGSNLFIFNLYYMYIIFPMHWCVRLPVCVCLFMQSGPCV